MDINSVRASLAAQIKEKETGQILIDKDTLLPIDNNSNIKIDKSKILNKINQNKKKGPTLITITPSKSFDEELKQMEFILKFKNKNN